MASEPVVEQMLPAKPAPAPVRALIGGVCWIVCVLWFQPRLELAILWFGALALVPLALGLHARLARHRPTEASAQHPPARPARRATEPSVQHPPAFRPGLDRFVVPAALLLVAGTSLDGDWRVRLALAAPWVVLTLLIAGVGVIRLARPSSSRGSRIASWGLVLFAVSGVTAGAYAAGHELFGFPLLIVLLTAIHQMYAGLILQTVAGCVVAVQPGRFALSAALGVTLGNPLVALGITATHLGAPPLLEFLAVCFYAPGVILLGWVQLYVAFRRKSGLPLLSRALLVVSELALGTALILAIIFAWGTARGWPTLSIPEMIFWHGTLNAFGFALLALIGWTLARPVARVQT